MADENILRGLREEIEECERAGNKVRHEAAVAILAALDPSSKRETATKKAPRETVVKD